MKWFHLPKIAYIDGTLLFFETLEGNHYAKYTFTVNRQQLTAVDSNSIEDYYDEQTVLRLLNESLPMKISVAYDAKNLNDSKPNLLEYLSDD